MPAAPALTHRITASPLLGLVLACVACLVPFVNKAFHIDDTLFIYAARQIQADPINFYGFPVNWYGTPQGMWDVMQNPPLASYYIALASGLFGENEVALHLAFLLPAIGVIWGTYRLAEQLCTRPVFAALSTLLTPAFLVSSTNLMCDTLMLCAWVWAVVFWERGLRQARMGLLMLAAVLISCAALTKYIGVGLVPLLLAYTVVRQWRRGDWVTAIIAPCLPLLVPVVVLITYQLMTEVMYGHGLLFQAAGYAASVRHAYEGLVWAVLTSFAFLGGGMVTLLFCLPLLWSWRVLLGGLIVTAVATVASARLLTVSLSLGEGTSIPWLTIGQFGLFVPAGFGLLALTYGDLRRRRDASSVLLALWVGGIFAFATFLNWTINVRSLLPLLPAVSILIARRLDARFPQPVPLQDQTAVPLPAARRVEERYAPPGRIVEQGPARRMGTRRVEERFAPPGRLASQGAAASVRAGRPDDRVEPTGRIASGWLALPLVPAAVLTLLVTWADYRMAGAACSAAADMVARCREHPGTPWFQGHWGFQYYMDRAGVAPLDFHRQEPILRAISSSLLTAGVIPFDSYQFDTRPGDLIIYPGNNTNLNSEIPSGPWIDPPYYEEDVIACRWLATMDPSVGAGFYAGVWGPLPFAFGKVEPTRYRVRELATARGTRAAR